MRRLGLVVLLLMVVFAFAAPSSFGEKSKPTLKPPKKTTAPDKTDKAQGTTLEKAIYENIPKGFPLEMKWPFQSTKLGKIVDIWYQPAAEFFIDANTTAKIAGNIYFQTDKNTFCSLSEDGTLEWATDLSFKLTARPKVSAFGVYLGHLSKIVALDRRSGKITWMQDYDLSICTPLHVTASTIYCGTFNRLVVAIDRLTGHINWTFSLDGDIMAAPTDPFSPKAADYVLAPCFNGDLYAISASGEEKWRFRTHGRIMSTPISEVIGEETYVFFGSQDTNLYCVNAISSQKMWEFRSGASIEQAPILVGENIYFKNALNDFHCVSKLNGTLKWKATNVTGIAGSVPGGDVYVVYANNTLAAVNPQTGAQRWIYDMKNFAKFITNPHDSTVYGLTKNGLILTFQEVIK